MSAQCVQCITLKDLSHFTSSASEPLQERECCLLEVRSTTSAAQHMLRRTRHPLPFLLFRAAAAGKRRRSGEAEREWDRLDLTHFLFFPWCACYACTLLNSRTRQYSRRGGRMKYTVGIRSPARTDVCRNQSSLRGETCRQRRCSRKYSKPVWRSKIITGARWARVCAKWRLLTKSKHVMPLVRAMTAYTRDQPTYISRVRGA